MAGQLAILVKTSWSLTSHIPSTDHRQLLGLFASFSLRLLHKYISIFFYFVRNQFMRENAMIRKLGKYGKTIHLQLR